MPEFIESITTQLWYFHSTIVQAMAALLAFFGMFLIYARTSFNKELEDNFKYVKILVNVARDRDESKSKKYCDQNYSEYGGQISTSHLPKSDLLEELEYYRSEKAYEANLLNLYEQTFRLSNMKEIIFSNDHKEIILIMAISITVSTLYLFIPTHILGFLLILAFAFGALFTALASLWRATAFIIRTMKEF